MTCVIGLRIDGEVWIASDGLVSDSQTRSVIARPKHERIGQHLIGWAGPMGHAQFAMREARKFGWNMEFADDFAGVLRSAAAQDKIDDFGAVLLVVSAHGIFEVDSSFGVTQHADEFAAIGSGCPFALGVLSATRESSMCPFDRLKLALSVASKYDAATGGTFNLERL